VRAKTVLIIEDDAGVRALLSALLTPRGYDVLEAADGWAGIARARAALPDAILLDLGLPYMEGTAVLDALKLDDVTAGIPVVMVTGRDDTGSVAAALDAGAHDYVRKPFDNEELAARVGAAVRAKLRYDAMQEQRTELERLATIDDLCGMPNRRALDAELHRQVARSERSGRPFAVLVADVDHFKRVNDEHGHAAGDEVLREVARRMQGRVRRGDVVGRWGGEEFMVLLPDTDAATAESVAEALRLGIAAEPAAGVPVTTSFGVAAWDRESAQSLVDRADLALYEAKAAGRDRVHAAAARMQRVA
jgi:two-component system, cell cycle response regulator